MYLLEGIIRNAKLSLQERDNNIAAILYGQDIKTNICICINRKEFTKFLLKAKKNCYVIPLRLKIAKQDYTVIIKDIQWHKLTTLPEHIDFFSIKKINLLKVKYNINYINNQTCIGIKNGGKLRILSKQLTAFVNPHKMLPYPYLEIDLQNLQIGEKISTQFLEEKYISMYLKIPETFILATIINN
jgi:large subunit ribosomal protein L25